MDDARDPRDTRPDADAEEFESRPDADAEEFESQPAAMQPSSDEQSADDRSDVDPQEDAAADDATAEWPVADAAQTPPPSEAETHSTETLAAADEPSAAEHPPSDVEAYASQPAAAQSSVEDQPTAHSVPATGVGESTQCPRCGTENRPGLAFCRNCGQRLMAAGGVAAVQRPGTPEGTQACPRCGTHNRAGTAFCQNCGANLRAAETASGYVPPAVSREPSDAAEPAVEGRAHAVLGPIVLLIGAVGLITGWLLPFAYGSGSLFERSFGSAGYGVAFWNGYPDVIGGLADQGYFGFAAPAPLLVVLLVVLAIAGFAKARPGVLQSVGLVIALIWSIGLAVLFLVVEVFGGVGNGFADMLRNLTPGGIIFFLASLIVLIGTLTRFARG